MTIWHPGDVVVAPFGGAEGIKMRPAVVVTTDLYHTTRPDVLLGIITSQVAKATQPTDYVLQDWQAASLRFPSAFRAYFTMVHSRVPRPIGRLSDRDWAEVQARLRLAIAV